VLGWHCAREQAPGGRRLSRVNACCRRPRHGAGAAQVTRLRPRLNARGRFTAWVRHLDTTSADIERTVENLLSTYADHSVATA